VTVWYILLVACLVAFIFGFIYLYVLKVVAGFIVYLSILVISLALIGFGAWLWINQDNYNENNDNKQYMRYGAYVVWGICALFVLIILCIFGRIRLGIAVLHCSADFINATPSVFLVPIVFLFLVVSWIAIWVVSAAWIFSVGEIKPNETVTVLSTVEWDKQTRYIFLYYLFGLLWINAFLIGCIQFIISAACSIWYFSFTSDEKGKGSLTKGVKWIYRFHIGSIAFGSCLIAIIQFIRILFEYYRKKAQAGTNNKVLKVLFCLTSYCLWCLEKCVKFITKNAYIQIALTGKNFCVSAKNAFFLVMNNVIRFGAMHTLGCIFMFLGKLFVISLTGLICYLIIVQAETPGESISSPWFPVIVTCIIAYLIGSGFMSVVSFSMDTILQCFLLDEEMLQRGKGRPSSNRPP